ncbi:hypothetical protein [Streptomyces phytohabitans]|uniref:hypothetical protein n=1 Tax=Streptomyces phytohabitans TaxID=1150371 RepID=UPI00345C056D
MAAYLCHALTTRRRPCRQPVRVPDTRCFWHPGKPRFSASPARSPRRPARRPTHAPSGRTAGPLPGAGGSAPYAELLTPGAVDAIGARAGAYAPRGAWQELVRGRRGGGCDDLARLARAVLAGRDLLQDAVGDAVGGLARTPVERVFTRELARRLPLPPGAQLAAAARGLQIAGICACALDGRLPDCACLRDVARHEGEDHVRRLLDVATEDWQHLPGGVG